MNTPSDQSRGITRQEALALRELGPEQGRMFEAGASGTMAGDYLTTRGQGAEEDRQVSSTVQRRTRPGPRPPPAPRC